MMRLLVLASLLIVPAFVSADEIANSGAVTEAIPLLLWAASDPKEDAQAAKIDAAKFYQFTEKYREDFLKFYNKLNIIGATKFLQEHAEESGTQGVNWVLVFAKILEKKVAGQTEEKEHGLPSLVAWAVRNTGPGTKLTSVKRETLVSFLLSHKTDILKYTNAGDVDGLVKFLDSTKAESTSNDVDWKTVINDLKDNRQLFKSSCGLLGLQLCDNIKQ
uniref:Secreted protein 19 n=3 Tax=Tetranychus evansi TaxID=178897 RepID=A0A142BYI5_9ACAR|nr:secreted protein 19 [Tetranychus evansi]